MSVYVTHYPIENGSYIFSAEPISLEVANNAEAVEYFDKHLKDQLAQVRSNELQKIKEDPLGSVTLIDVIERLLGANDGRKPNSLLDSLTAWPWQISFYEHPEYQGDSFKLGVVQQTHHIVAANPPLLSTLDWQSDLTRWEDSKWDNRISSLECHSYAKYWVLCEHPNFGGTWWWGHGSYPIFKRKEQGGPDDMVSSIMMSSISSLAIETGIKLLLR
jgi:hypothetical protein